MKKKIHCGNQDGDNGKIDIFYNSFVEKITLERKVTRRTICVYKEIYIDFRASIVEQSC